MQTIQFTIPCEPLVYTENLFEIHQSEIFLKEE